MTVGVGQIMTVVAEMAFMGQKVLNVYDLLNSGIEVTNTEALEDAGEFMEVLYTEAKSIMTTALEFVSITARNANTSVDVGATDWPTLTTGSISTNQFMPSQVSALVTFPTIYPKVRGRKFIPGIAESEVTDGLLVSSAISALEAYASQLLGTYAAPNSSWQYTVLRNGTPTTQAAPTTAIVRNILSTLTRRKVGVGS